MAIYDVTLPFSESLPLWPGDPPILVEPAASIGWGDGYNLHRLQFGTHTGTHMDAPFHYLDGGTTVDRIPLETLVGEAWVCRIADSASVVTAGMLEAAAIPTDARRLLFHTANSDLWNREEWAFTEQFVALDASAARWLVERGILLAGIDYLSIDRFDDEGSPVHKSLLSAGVVIVEGLDLRQVPEGRYQLCCLPLRLAGCDGSPVRAILSDSRQPQERPLR